MPIYFKTSGIRETAFTDTLGEYPVQLKTPYSDGTTHVIFEPLDCMSHILVLHPSGDFSRANRLSCRFVIAKLAALAAKPRVNLTRFHGVFAPNSKHRVEVTPAKRGKGSPSAEVVERTPEQRHQAMTSPNVSPGNAMIVPGSSFRCGFAIESIA